MKKGSVLEPDTLKLGNEDFEEYEAWSAEVDEKMDAEEEYTTCLNFLNGEQGALDEIIEIYCRDHACSWEEALSKMASKVQSGKFNSTFGGYS